MLDTEGYNKVIDWFTIQEWQPQVFQKEAWEAYLTGISGLINAPTGSGKTYAILLPAMIDFINKHPKDYAAREKNGLKMIWITPIRALTKEIAISCEKAIKALGLKWRVEIRSGDTSTKDRIKQLKNPPEILISTPESLHVLMATKGYTQFFGVLEAVIVDEWHELFGSKRGVQTELFINRMSYLNPSIKTWGISATVGNLPEAMEVLLFSYPPEKRILIKSNIKKNIVLHTIYPDEVEEFPWAGHLGLRLADKVLPILEKSKTTLIFTNTRAQCEIWYQKLLEINEDLAGQIAMHHGSISKDLRTWVEEALYLGDIKAVVCTSSLDLGVDFRPVENVIQIGSPKGVSRFIQRAGRSGHQPGADSHIWFLPTHALELVEAAGLRLAIAKEEVEERIPYIRSFDVLIQYMMTLAVSEGFYPDEIYHQVTNTYCYHSISKEEWLQLLNALRYGSDSLQAYDEYKKIDVLPDGKYTVTDRGKALKHRLSIGTIVSDVMISIKLQRGTRLGSIEEYFVSQLSPGDHFWFAGRALEFIRIKEMTAQVKLSKAKTGKIPSYQGGRMPLSSQMTEVLREKIYNYMDGIITDDEIAFIVPLFEMQRRKSVMPRRGEFLVEYFQSKEGYHLVMYPFEGRSVHEGMAALIGKRIAMLQPITFTIAMNDLGFELLSDQKIDIDKIITKQLFDTKNLVSDIQSSINSVEMARRKFRDIARISGLIFTGYPGKPKKDRHLQASSQLIFEVFKDFEPNNLLYRQTYEEVMTFQLEESRLRNALNTIVNSDIIISRPQKATPFAFPLLVDRLREKLSSEKIEDRVAKMKADLIK